MEIATARVKAREVLERTAAELEELKSELASEFCRLRDRDQSTQEAETTDDQVRALDNVISAIKAARSVLE
jgi:sugar-specific transcriptional regulator TrmB